MRIVTILPVATLMLAAPMLAAQQPQPGPGRPANTAMAQQRMRMMDSLNARLDTLVIRMNQTTGAKKVAAMAEVITELVAQRKQMRGMMQSGRGMMMPMGKAPAPGESGRPPAPGDSAAADSAGHEEHHPAD